MTELTFDCLHTYRLNDLFVFLRYGHSAPYEVVFAKKVPGGIVEVTPDCGDGPIRVRVCGFVPEIIPHYTRESAKACIRSKLGLDSCG